MFCNQYAYVQAFDAKRFDGFIMLLSFFQGCGKSLSCSRGSVKIIVNIPRHCSGNEIAVFSYVLCKQLGKYLVHFKRNNKCR